MAKPPSPPKPSSALLSTALGRLEMALRGLERAQRKEALEELPTQAGRWISASFRVYLSVHNIAGFIHRFPKTHFWIVEEIRVFLVKVIDGFF